MKRSVVEFSRVLGYRLWFCNLIRKALRQGQFLKIFGNETKISAKISTMDSYSDIAQESEDPMRTPLTPQDPPTLGFFETLYPID